MFTQGRQPAFRKECGAPSCSAGAQPASSCASFGGSRAASDASARSCQAWGRFIFLPWLWHGLHLHTWINGWVLGDCWWLTRAIVAPMLDNVTELICTCDGTGRRSGRGAAAAVGGAAAHSGPGHVRSNRHYAKL